MPSLISYIKEVFKKLDENHFKVLRVIESNLSRFEVVPRDVIYRESGLGNRADKILKKLHEYKLIWAPLGLDRGFCLNYNGLDLLALKTLVDGNVLESLGKPLGVGKEADVYDAISPTGERLAVKFFRIGRTSFRRYERHRTALLSAHNYMSASMKSAAREYQALRILSPRGVRVPRPRARNRHVVVTDFFQGIELASAHYLTSPMKILGEVLEDVKKARDAGVVHSDLSAYNVLVTPDEEILIIDWPQWVTPSHPMAMSFLRRDLAGLLKFFRRRWRILELPPEYQRLIRDICGENFLT